MAQKLPLLGFQVFRWNSSEFNNLTLFFGPTVPLERSGTLGGQSWLQVFRLWNTPGTPLFLAMIGVFN